MVAPKQKEGPQTLSVKLNGDTFDMTGSRETVDRLYKMFLEKVREMELARAKVEAANTIAKQAEYAKACWRTAARFKAAGRKKDADKWQRRGDGLLQVQLKRG